MRKVVAVLCSLYKEGHTKSGRSTTWTGNFKWMTSAVGYAGWWNNVETTERAVKNFVKQAQAGNVTADVKV